jgi:hypothetical protein
MQRAPLFVEFFLVASSRRDIFENTFVVHHHACCVFNYAGVVPHPDTRAICFEKLHLVIAHDPVFLHHGLPSLAVVGVNIGPLDVHGQKLIQVFVAQHPEQSRVGIEDSAAGGAQIHADRGLLKQMLVTVILFDVHCHPLLSAVCVRLLKISDPINLFEYYRLYLSPRLDQHPR